MSLPRVWRPFAMRLVGSVLGISCLALAVFGFTQLPPEIQARFSFSDGVSLSILISIFFMSYYFLARSRVVAREEGLEIRNGFKTRHYTWPEVVAVSMPGGAPWALFDISDGTTVAAFGIQSSDGQRAIRAVRELRTLID